MLSSELDAGRTRRQDPFGASANLQVADLAFRYSRLQRLADLGLTDIARLPYSIRVLLENVLRHCDGYVVTEDQVTGLAAWSPEPTETPAAIGFTPERVLLQDFTGIPAVADLAAMRAAVMKLGGDPRSINPIVPVDLVIDHSVQIDAYGSASALGFNVAKEYERNRERYLFLKWAQQAFRNFRVVPPGTGIVHQVNLEYLASVVTRRVVEGVPTVFPDTVVGTDSHTTMINGLGVLGFGVGGIEAEAVMLGQPFAMLAPQVIGVRMTGALPEGATATDLVLTAVQMLRRFGVVDKFVEFYGPGLSTLSLADRATIGNMAPEYGATVGYFPVDEQTLRYLRSTGRSSDDVDLVERYTKEQQLFRLDHAPEPAYTHVLHLDLSSIEPSVAGPRRPQDRVPLSALKESVQVVIPTYRAGKPDGDAVKSAPAVLDSGEVELRDGAVAIAAITSCTNTSNPAILIAAGLVARNAVEKGLKVKPYVKTSLAPGSRVVVDYLDRAGLTPYLEALGYHVVGFGCTTCIGNSGPLPNAVAVAVQSSDLVVAAVLSGNRNFEGRINPLCRMSFLASPPLVVAFALAGRTDIDFATEPIGVGSDGDPVFLKDIWPSSGEIASAVAYAVQPEMFASRYADVFEGDAQWRDLPAPTGDVYTWDPESTYIQEPPFFADMPAEPAPLNDVIDARVLVSVGDSVTTDHISPAGSIPVASPAGNYLISRGVRPADFNSFGARRGNHEVLVRGTFANIRLRNRLVPGVEGGVTRHLPSNEQTSIYDASLRYAEERVPLIVLAGREYGTGSSRDWAAKGPLLLGVRAAIAESFERIHRSNLIGMGIMPIEFVAGENLESLGLTGEETYSIRGIAKDLTPGKMLDIEARRADGNLVRFQGRARINSVVEADYFRNGGILQMVLRGLAAE